MPLGPEYDKLDRFAIRRREKHRQPQRRSITAAQFLQRFVDGTPWAHLDIAGTAMGAPKRDQSKLGFGLWCPAAGSGWSRIITNQEIAESRMTESFYSTSARHVAGKRLAAVARKVTGAWMARGRAVRHRHERADALDAHLWTYRDDSFLPHATWRVGDAQDQPIVLAVEDSNPNQANVRFLVDSAPLPADCGAYDRVVLVFNGDDGEALAAARSA